MLKNDENLLTRIGQYSIFYPDLSNRFWPFRLIEETGGANQFLWGAGAFGEGPFVFVCMLEAAKATSRFCDEGRELLIFFVRTLNLHICH